MISHINQHDIDGMPSSGYQKETCPWNQVINTRHKAQAEGQCNHLGDFVCPSICMSACLSQPQSLYRINVGTYPCQYLNKPLIDLYLKQCSLQHCRCTYQNVIIQWGPDSLVDHYTLLEPTKSHSSQLQRPLQPNSYSSSQSEA